MPNAIDAPWRCSNDHLVPKVQAMKIDVFDLLFESKMKGFPAWAAQNALRLQHVPLGTCFVNSAAKAPSAEVGRTTIAMIVMASSFTV